MDTFEVFQPDISDKEAALKREEGFLMLESIIGTWGDIFEREGGIEKFLR